MGVRCMQLLRANGAWSCYSHRAPEDSRCHTGDGAGSVTKRELTDKIQQAEQLLLARLEDIVASVVTGNSREQHAGRRKDAELRDHVTTLLAAFEHIYSRVEVRSNAD